MIKKILTIILTMSMISPLFPAEFENLWGISSTDLVSRLKIENFTIFKPEDKPAYSNKIIDYFNTMNPDTGTKISILRTNGKPEIDFCFFNEKLYSISEDWGPVDTGKADIIIRTLKEKYSVTSIDHKNPEIIYNLKKDKTKIYIYKKSIDEKSASIRILYYSTDLFRMLFNE